MKIKEVMTKAPACCALDTPLDAVTKLMIEHDCGGIPVCDGGRLVGVVTDRDIVVRGFTTGRNPLDTPVSAVMTKHPIVIGENEDADVAAALMEENQVRRLPVTREGKVIGIVSQADIVSFLPERKVVNLMKAVSQRQVVAL
jgi:CBS domain-containing protein